MSSLILGERPELEAELGEDCAERGQWKPWQWGGLWQDCVKGEGERLSDFTTCNYLPQSIGHCSRGSLNSQPLLLTWDVTQVIN